MKSTIAATKTALVLAALSSTLSADGFSLPSPATIPAVSKTTTTTALDMANSKGFGNTPPPPKKKAKKAPDQPEPPTQQRQKDDTQITSSDDNEFNPFDKSTQTVTRTDTSRGKAALDKMRRERAEQRNAELQKMKDVQDVDKMMLETGGEAAVIPEKVAQRMGKRMLPFVGIPLLGGMGAFVGFWYMATYRDMEFQPVLVAGTTIALLAVGLVGITYSMMSASWDPEREGSVLGTDEFSRNIDNIKGGLSRSKENAQVREQIMLEENFARQKIQKEKPKKPAASSLAEKMGDELE
mmetsp:Transcript_7168/g.14642  ORF Transcript_7168/g.14642 Transcript_7168/m.14642 type:complete len:296 (-) Transcript_7168:330-1217(-)|eukprot:CAMPEP_0201123380 /NCGR_PEP_ID=MMETSP0850-20130426/6756_1 /ASSEMBLY_ACC=CAM_ASM_000622 /TAXON_ID=183588 /ORGANISM="Pseudo-nitzschia fraudulenta, Strain WWA7" /LENGTH=295 /DNA_ID=CAMNT_0047390263 /DNA_START=142 /DNA_END=1029 /DNA_ORIENTATION=+